MDRLSFGVQLTQRSLQDLFLEVCRSCLEEDSNRAVILGGLNRAPISIEPLCFCCAFEMLMQEDSGMTRQPFFLGRSCVNSLVPELDDGCTASSSEGDFGAKGSRLHDLAALPILSQEKATRGSESKKLAVLDGVLYERLSCAMSAGESNAAS